MKPSILANITIPFRKRRVSVLFLFWAFSLTLCADAYSQQNSLEPLLREGRIEEALAQEKKAVKQSLSKHGRIHGNTGASYCNLGSVYEESGEFEEAKRCFTQAYEILGKTRGRSHEDTVYALQKLGDIEGELGNYRESESLYRKAIAIAQKRGGDTYSLRMDLAGVLRDLGNYEEAESLNRQFLREAENRWGPNSDGMATALNNLAGLYREIGLYSKAEPLFLRSIAINEKIGGNGLDVTLHNLGNLYQEKGDHEKAKALLDRSLKLMEQRVGKDHPDIAMTVSKIAAFHESQKRYGEAEALRRRVLVIREKAFGENHPGTALAMNNLAVNHILQNNLDWAEALFVRVLPLMESTWGTDHEFTNRCRESLASVYLDLARIFGNDGMLGVSKKERALQLLSKSIESKYRAQQRRLLYFPDGDLISVAKKAKPSDYVLGAEDGDLAARHQIWFKGAVQEALINRRNEASRVSGDKQGKDMVERRAILQISVQQSFLKRGENDRITLDLQKQVDELDLQINQYLKRQTLVERDGIGLSQVTASLSSDEVLVESFRYSDKLNDGSFEDRYASTLIFKDGPAKYIPHKCAAVEMDQSIERYRNQLGNRKIPEAAIYLRYLKPIEGALEPGKTVIFSLDSQLHFMPLHMIRGQDGIPFGQKYHVRYVTSGRDLVKRTQLLNKSKKALLLGNPSFRNNDPLMALSFSPELHRNRDGSIVKVNGGMSFVPLPGTAREIDVLGEKLATHGYQIQRLGEEMANEKSFMQEVRGSKVVHLATHGFFLESNMVQDPMFSSGLALSGAQSTFNLWNNGQIPPPSTDGILTAAEANLLDLQGTDLVVLSACETAMGKALDGEGVMGLRRAFITAGANSTIMTLWPVDDSATVQLMDAFYDKYLQGVHPAVALAEVQRELYQPFIEKYGENDAISRLAPFVCVSIGEVHF